MKSFGLQQPWERSIKKMQLESLRLVKAGPDQGRKFTEERDPKKEGRKIRLGKQEKHSFQVE